VGNLSRGSLASGLAGNRFDGRVLLQLGMKRLVDGLFMLSRRSWPTRKEVDVYKFEKYVLTCVPSRIRTCAHGSGGRSRSDDGTGSELRKRAVICILRRSSIAILSRVPERGRQSAPCCRSVRSAATVHPGCQLILSCWVRLRPAYRECGREWACLCGCRAGV